MGLFATDIYLPALPAMSEHFHSNTLVQFTLSAYLLASGVAPLFLGPLSDRIGRKPVITSGLFLSICTTFYISYSNNIYLIIMARFLQGVALAGSSVSVRAMVSDKLTGKALAKFHSFTTLFIPIVLMLAPVIGGIIQKYTDNWRAVFMSLCVYQCIALINTVFFLKETNTASVLAKSQNQLTVYKALLSNRAFVLYGFLPSITMIGVYAYLTIAPFLFQSILALNPMQYGFISVFLASMVVLSAFTNIHLLNYWDSKKILYFAAGIPIISSFYLAYIHYFDSHAIGHIIYACGIYFYSLNVSFSNAVSSAFQQIQGHYGSATALISSTQMFCAMLISMLCSVLSSNDVEILMYLYALLGCLYAATVLLANQFSDQLRYNSSQS